MADYQQSQTVYEPQSQSYAKRDEQEREESEKLTDVVASSMPVLFRAKTIFPFNFFPDELIVDATKVSIIHSVFFLSKQIQSINIEDIMSVSVSYTWFMAAITFSTRFFNQTEITIKNMWKSEAEEARRIVQGLIIVQSKGVKLKDVPPEEIAAQIQQVGRVQK